MPSDSLLEADYKAPGGKLVRVRLARKDDVISWIKVYGDFFLIPEDSLLEMENLLRGTLLREEEVKHRLDRFFALTGVQTLGESTEDFVKAILSAKPVV